MRRLAGVVDVVLTKIVGEYWLCFLGGHRWNIPPPWNTMELQSTPYCQNCGQTYVQILPTDELDAQEDNR